MTWVRLCYFPKVIMFSISCELLEPKSPCLSTLGVLLKLVSTQSSGRHVGGTEKYADLRSNVSPSISRSCLRLQLIVCGSLESEGCCELVTHLNFWFNKLVENFNLDRLSAFQNISQWMLNVRKLLRIKDLVFICKWSFAEYCQNVSVLQWHAMRHVFILFYS